MSKTETTTQPAGHEPRLEATTGQGQKLAVEELPPPNPNLEEAREDKLSVEVDLLSSTENERETFPEQYKNSDYLLQDYRNKLRAVLEVEHCDRDEAYQNLQKAIFTHPKTNFKFVQQQLLEWARNGYNGEPPEDYFDENGNKRSKSEEDEAAYSKRVADTDADMNEDQVELPSDMTFYNGKWKQATPILERLYRSPMLYKDADQKHRKMIDQINHDLKKKQLDDRCPVDLTVPVFELMHFLVQSTHESVAAEAADSQADKQALWSKANAQHQVLLERIHRAQQPEKWVTAVVARVKEKVKLVVNKVEPNGQLWEDGFLERLKEYSEPSKDTPKSKSTGKPSETVVEPNAASQASPDADSQGTSKPNEPPKKNSGAMPSLASTGNSPFEPSERKGFVRYKISPNFVTYKGEERKIAYSRRVGKFLHGDAYQVFVQVNDNGSQIPIWDIVASSNFERGLVERFKNAGGKDVSTMKGTRDDIGDKTIDQFNFGGIATVPRESGEDYCRNPMQFILGCFDGEDERFWDRSTLGRAWRQKAIDQIIDRLVEQAGGTLQPKPMLKAKRERKRKTGIRRQQQREESEDELESEGEPESESESEPEVLTKRSSRRKRAGHRKQR